ncbi:MAG: hypothetical protein HQL14_06095 [Candidatus Omnitrophica bacterium]|nr:hypothetical protein [Candidatus Omnitrophota bacterium]
MKKNASPSSAHKALFRRYLLWAYKTTKESFERIERKTTQLIVDEYILDNLKTKSLIPEKSKGGYNIIVDEFEAYIKAKRADQLKLKFLNRDQAALHPQYLYLKYRLKAIEAAIRHFLGLKELHAIEILYEKEMTQRILQARDH